MFWMHEEELPPGVGNEPFCTAHLIYLAIFLFGTIAYALLYRRWPEKNRRKADAIVAAVVFFFGLGEYVVTAILGYFTKYTLPIHVCALMIFVVVLHAALGAAKEGSKAARFRSFLAAVLFHPGILGTWAALLFPDWLYYPFWNYLSICGFIMHGFISFYGASVIVRGLEAPNPRGLFKRDLRDSLLFILGGAVLMYFFDKLTGTDYWFMAWPGNNSPLMDAYVNGGWSGYILAYFLAAAVVTGLWFGLRWVLVIIMEAARRRD